MAKKMFTSNFGSLSQALLLGHLLLRYSLNFINFLFFANYDSNENILLICKSAVNLPIKIA